jgi:hypothetical protein
MPNEFSRGTQDAEITKSITLPNTATAVTTADIDLGTNSKGFFTEYHEVEVFIPAMTAAIFPATGTITILLQNGTTTPTSTATIFTRTLTGSASPTPETSVRWRLPAAALQYLNARFTIGGTVGTGMNTIVASVRVLT